MTDLLLSFYGDDFTGSTDAMESLALAGVRTVLFTAPPTQEQLARYDGMRAFGVAGTTRAMSSDAIERELRPALAALHDAGAPIIHYKVCSTFDSSPTVGSIGRAIDVGLDVFGQRCLPLVVGAPSLGRYCVFGNLFARLGHGGEAFRIDRHPSMSRHPVTPMREADLRLHLALQTSIPIQLLDVRGVSLPPNDAERAYQVLLNELAGPGVILIDALDEAHMATIGQLLAAHARRATPLLVVGSSGVESALTAHWQRQGIIKGSHTFPSLRDAGPILAVCGSCSPVTRGQIEHAIANGFAEATVDVGALADAAARDRAIATVVQTIVKALGGGRSIVLHTAAPASDVERDPTSPLHIGVALGEVVLEVLAQTGVRRVAVAGGDTSGAIAGALGIESMEMVGPLVRGAPLCKVSAPSSPAHGIEITFKGGQIGPPDFFERVLSPRSRGES